MKLPLALIMAIAVQAGGLLWYVSKIDSKVEVMYTQFEKSNQKAVIENQVRMHIDLQNVVEGLVFTSTQIEQLTQMVENVRKTNAQLIRQNEKIKNTITNLKKQITELKKGNQKKKKKKDGDKELG